MNPEQIIDPAPDHFKELLAEVKYSDMPEQTKKRVKEIILKYELWVSPENLKQRFWSEETKFVYGTLFGAAYPKDGLIKIKRDMFEEDDNGFCFCIGGGVSKEYVHYKWADYGITWAFMETDFRDIDGQRQKQEND